jgi:TonB family protein
MMSAYANSLQKPPRFDMYVRKLQSICAMHGVQIGLRTDLSGFMEKLAEDRHLAMDFWAFVGKLSSREGGDLSDDQVLNIIVESVTDSEIQQEDVGLKRFVDDLRAMLAGVDIQSPGQTQIEHAPFPRSEAGPQQSEGEGRSRSVVEFPMRVDEEATSEPVSPHTTPQRLEEELVRRELTRLLKQYFDEIDKRLSKLEPHSGETTSLGTIASATTRRSLEEPADGEMEQQRLKRISRLVLQPESFLEDSLVSPDPKLPRVPLQGYSESTGYGKFFLILLLLAWLIGAVAAVYPYRTPMWESFTTWVRHQTRTPEVLAPTVLLPPRPVTTDQEPLADQTAKIQSSAGQSVLEGTSNPPPMYASGPGASVGSRASGSGFDLSTGRKAINGRAPEHTASVGSRAGGNGVGLSNRRRSVLNPGINPAPIPVEQPQAPVNSATSVDTTRVVQVDSSVMEANLISSRVPVYPEAAKSSRVSGHVVMQAIISKDGSVTGLHVTEGDSRLRAAAEDAVYKWRYRPYLIDGQPVEVTTTITVDFQP